MADSTNTDSEPSARPVKLDESDDKERQDVDTETENRTNSLMQKRRRVTRACDECRRKKIKCDGKQPCTHCTVYSYECTYDQPSNRRRNPAPQYIETLEHRLQKAEAIIRAALPAVDLDDPKYEARDINQLLQMAQAQQRQLLNQSESLQHPEEDARMRSMVDRTGSLDLDDGGNYDYHGGSSGHNFMRKFRAQFGESLLPVPKPISMDSRGPFNTIESPRSQLSTSPQEISTELPDKQSAMELCRNALDDCCALQRPIHKPRFWQRFEALYATETDHFTNEQMKFIPLLWIVMAVGTLFGDANQPNPPNPHDSMNEGYLYFSKCRAMVEITDCRDLVSIQTIAFMILFLQGTAKLATCYAYIGIALRGCCRLGMHRKLTGQFSPVEEEERKKLFWQIRKMDIYVGAMLGLPQMLSDDDMDQEYPLEVLDDQITENGILPTQSSVFALQRASNAHTKLLTIMQKVVRYVYPVKQKDKSAQDDDYTISHSNIRELERDLQQWMDQLPMELRPSEDIDTELARVQQLLRMAYAYVQMMIYRPFLHYVGQACQHKQTDKRSFACAAACVSVARNIVHITSQMKRRGLLIGAYWFVMYTTYFGILSLLYFVLENPESMTSKEILRDAVEGRDTLAKLADRSMAAHRCTESLKTLFDALPEKMSERRSSLKAQPNSSKKRPPPTTDPPFFRGNVAAQSLPVIADTHIKAQPYFPPRSSTSEHSTRTSGHKQSLSSSASNLYSAGSSTLSSAWNPNFPDTLTPETGNSATSQHHTPDASQLDFNTPMMQQGNLPDLRDVMFPSNDPFAYPKQPISTLDTMAADPFGNNEFMQHGYNIPVNVPQQTAFAQDQNPELSHTPSYQEQFVRQARNIPTQVFNHQSFTNEPTPMFNPQFMDQQSVDMGQQAQDDDYWAQAQSKNFRTGFTPGGPAINFNMDQVFGNSQAWNMHLSLPQNDNTHQQADNMWPGPQVPRWQ